MPSSAAADAGRIAACANAGGQPQARHELAPPLRRVAGCDAALHVRVMHLCMDRRIEQMRAQQPGRLQRHADPFAD
jgi:hypothetical protein